MDAVKDDDGESQDIDAISIFNDPFEEERQFDRENWEEVIDLERGDDVHNIKLHSLNESGKKKKELLVTGGYKQDIECLMDRDILSELVPQKANQNEIVKEAMMQYVAEVP